MMKVFAPQRAKSYALVQSYNEGIECQTIIGTYSALGACPLILNESCSTTSQGLDSTRLVSCALAEQLVKTE